MDLHAALDVATAGFARTLALVKPEQWESATPNQGWSVRDLVNHVVGGNRRYVLLLAGAPTAEVEALRDVDHLTDDPYADFLSTAAEVSTAFAEPGVLDRVAHHGRGDRSGAELLVMRVSEHALHGWDLARAIGQDDRIDPPVVDVLLAAIDADPTSPAWAAFTPLPGADDLIGAMRLLALTGRA
ncbi:MAG TPA: TIGR03086 family metal-binding protein [Mycobacteriales bacterium]|nr:TIGR03086 family metal-binding protein [Mycobacteriales bacterium]